VRSRPGVIRVALEEDTRTNGAAIDVVGACRRECIDPTGVIGVSSGSAQKNGIASRARKSPAGCVSVIVRVSPLATTLEMSAMNPCAGELMIGSLRRSYTNLKVCAVTFSVEGGEKA